MRFIFFGPKKNQIKNPNGPSIFFCFKVRFVTSPQKSLKLNMKCFCWYFKTWECEIDMSCLRPKSVIKDPTHLAFKITKLFSKVLTLNSYRILKLKKFCFDLALLCAESVCSGWYECRHDFDFAAVAEFSTATVWND